MNRIDRRTLLKSAVAAGGLAAVPAVTGSHDDEPGNPVAGFGGTSCDVPRDSTEYLPFDEPVRNGKQYGGWGGHEYHVTEAGLRGGENPVVFVHGNTHDACDFSDHATRYIERGYGGNQLWSITFNEATSTHAEMARQLDHFVRQVRQYTGARTVDVVSHSLGVTGVRMWMVDLRPYLADEGRWPTVLLSADEPAAKPRFEWVETFVGCAGANHGTHTCGPCEKGLGGTEPCNVISPLCADQPGEPLFDLNHYGTLCEPGDSTDCPVNETPGDDTVEYFTIRGELDYFYLKDPESPKLDGATNVLLPKRAHNATRASDVSIDLIYRWVTDGPLPDRPERDTAVSAGGSRSDGADVYTAGQPARVELTVRADRPVVLRDRIHYTWDVRPTENGDVTAVAPRPHRGIKELYFDHSSPTRVHDVTYVLEAPDASGTYDFGPAQVRRPDATEWDDVPNTTDRNAVVGASP